MIGSGMSTSIHRDAVRVRFTCGGERQMFAVASVDYAIDAGAAACLAYREIGARLQSSGFRIVQERVFGSLSVREEVLRARALVFGSEFDGSSVPLTFVEGRPLYGSGLAGIIIRAVALPEHEASITTVHRNGVPCGRYWKEDEAAYLVLQSIDGLSESGTLGQTPADYFRRLFDQLDMQLARSGFTFQHIVRTWFYFEALLEDYSLFNGCRREKFEKLRLCPGEGLPSIIPASTAVKAKNPRRAPAVADVIAARGVSFERISNPTQPEASSYGADFARGTVVPVAGARILHVSGTAAIDANGRSFGSADATEQIDAALCQVESLLRVGDRTLDKLAAGCAFLKYEHDAPALLHVLAQRNLTELPLVTIITDICRDELLFELDGEAL